VFTWLETPYTSYLYGVGSVHNTTTYLKDTFTLRWLGWHLYIQSCWFMYILDLHSKMNKQETFWKILIALHIVLWWVILRRLYFRNIESDQRKGPLARALHVWRCVVYVCLCYVLVLFVSGGWYSNCSDTQSLFTRQSPFLYISLWAWPLYTCPNYS